MDTPSILITAYALNPYKGSEDGTGWNLLLQAARHYRLEVFTRENNLPEIHRYLRECQADEHHRPDHRVLLERVRFHGYDLPAWARWWKKGARGSTAYFWLWQWGVAQKAAHLKRKGRLGFALAHALNFHSDAHPQFLYRCGVPVLWGPIGHHPPTPTAQLLFEGSRVDWLKDRIRWATKVLARRLDPFYRASVRRAAHILAVNPSVPDAVRLGQTPFTVFPAVGAADRGLNTEDSSAARAMAGTDQAVCFRVLSAGRLVPMKGFGIVLEAFARFYHQLPEGERGKVQWRIAGTGPLEAQLRHRAERLGLGKAVQFLGWVDHAAMEEEFRHAAVFAFGSHEGAGMVVPEALSKGIPVLCLDNPGPGFLTGSAKVLQIPDHRPDASIAGLTEGLQRLHSDPQFRLAAAHEALVAFRERHDWNRKGDVLRSLYARICGQEGSLPKAWNPEWAKAPACFEKKSDQQQQPLSPKASERPQPTESLLLPLHKIRRSA